MHDPVAMPSVDARAIHRTPRARVDLGRLVANARRLRMRAGGVGLLAVVKADAYGHGAVPVSRALEAEGVDGFCVATLAEALELRRAGLRRQLMVFGGIRVQDLPLASAEGIDTCVVSAVHLRELADALAAHPIGLHLEFDTGMGRSGLLPAELGACLDALRVLRPRILGAMTHFASADEPDPATTLRQRGAFAGILAALGDAGIHPAMVHTANSAGLLRGFAGGDSHARCGIALYGISPIEEAAGQEPVLELQAEVIRAVRVPAGTTVGYACTYTAAQAITLATLNCGYADGFPRALGNRAVAGFRGGHFPLVGRISMDSATVALPETVDVQPGESMVLLSGNPADPNSVLATARLLGTIPYEVTCGLNRRVVREPA